MDKLRIAMIGGGPQSMIGPVHRAAMRLTDEFELVAGSFSSNYQKSLDIGKSLGLEHEFIYSDYKGLANDAQKLRLDAVAILTPNCSHVEVASLFAAQGVHIICEKPLGASWEGIKELEAVVKSKQLSFVLTHPYSAYPVVRQAKQQLLDGRLGKIKMVAVEYLQGWLSELLESDENNRGAVWREDPAKGGPGGVLGDIGTHAFQLVEYVTGLSVISLLSEVSAMEGRKVPDDAHMLLRLDNGVKGSLWCSQVAVGCLNGLRLRVFGEKGSLSWFQEKPELLHLYDTDNNELVYHRGQSGEGTLPPGHPEGYHDGFAQVYKDAAEQIKSFKAGHGCTIDTPGLDMGIRGMRFIDAALKSSNEGGKWVPI